MNQLQCEHNKHKVLLTFQGADKYQLKLCQKCAEQESRDYLIKEELI